MKKLILLLLCFPLIGSGQGIYPYGYEKGSILVNDYGDTIYTITKNENGLIKDCYHLESGCCEGCWVQCPVIKLLGWSRKGLVAYIIHDWNYDNLIIQDARSDKVLVEISDPDTENIISELNKYNIINNRLSKYYSKIPEYEIDLITNGIVDYDDCMGEDVSYVLTVSNKLYGHKTIAQGYLGCVVYSGVFGYFKSPFENRILVLLYYVPEVDETEYHIIKCFGSSLDPSTFK
jgi:hypothetical protein